MEEVVLAMITISPIVLISVTIFDKTTPTGSSHWCFISQKIQRCTSMSLFEAFVNREPYYSCSLETTY